MLGHTSPPFTWATSVIADQMSKAVVLVGGSVLPWSQSLHKKDTSSGEMVAIDGRFCDLVSQPTHYTFQVYLDISKGEPFIKIYRI